ncbi:polysaccharide deacetylase family protein [Pseudosulfitobacter koreensis]|uniref:Polysaccharide deacetylase n=1 Tax=Pseudosulfitobacter koreensis TaxID=2968472 RepID=A0ABT1Z3Q2_9RHOB|nr:hypothetical protein [Pseudosulfitobacter koreense]MCR8827761.1 hypothetical protein [Pseudosulfitobacter koreense]
MEMQVDWHPLRVALRDRRAQKRPLQFWWRDDDAVAVTPDLERLEAMARAADVPVHIAVIPAHATRELAAFSAGSPYLIPLVHGWAHADTSAPGAKKSEFQRDRPEAAEETAKSLVRMGEFFVSGLVPMFVPPWNRIGDRLTAQLATQGYRGLSTFGTRGAENVRGLRVFNTHVDPIFWKGDQGLADTDWIIQAAVKHMESGSEEPLGLLTHHLVHTAEVWEFAARFIAELQDGGATKFDIAGALV